VPILIEDVDHTDSGPAADDARQKTQLTNALVTDLAIGTTGIAFVYRALDRLVDTQGLRDAAIVLDVAGLGRQVFRAGRQVLTSQDLALLEARRGCTRTRHPIHAASTLVPSRTCARSRSNWTCSVTTRGTTH
jgi:hypothetical protein